MKSFVALLFTCCFTVSFCFVGSLLAESDLIKRKEKCGEVSSWNCNFLSRCRLSDPAHVRFIYFKAANNSYSDAAKVYERDLFLLPFIPILLEHLTTSLVKGEFRISDRMKTNSRKNNNITKEKMEITRAFNGVVCFLQMSKMLRDNLLDFPRFLGQRSNYCIVRNSLLWPSQLFKNKR